MEGAFKMKHDKYAIYIVFLVAIVGIVALIGLVSGGMNGDLTGEAFKKFTPAIQRAVVATCTNSDGGFDIYESGSVIERHSDKSQVIRVDDCEYQSTMDNDIIMEYYCDGTEITGDVRNCPGRCANNYACAR